MNTPCKTLLFILLFALLLHAGQVGIGAGIYDFTDAVSKEFYLAAFHSTLSYETAPRGPFRLCTQLGLGGVKRPYNGQEHELFMGHLSVLTRISFLDDSRKWVPYGALGANITRKFDENEWFEVKRKSTSYGYVFLVGTERKVGKKLRIYGEITRHLQVPPHMEDLNTSGVVTQLGVKFNFDKKG